MMLNDKERKELLRIAREAIETYLEEKRKLSPELTGPFAEFKGVFVTLKKGKELRGCIGIVEPIYPLGSAVVKAAISSAFEDPRFYPLRKDEFEGLEIEISILTKPVEIDDPLKIDVGKHGIIIERGWNKGLLLPQVPLEYGWGLEEYLRNGCAKAGLEPECWRKGAKIYTFKAEVFSEKFDRYNQSFYNKNDKT